MNGTAIKRNNNKDVIRILKGHASIILCTIIILVTVETAIPR